MTLKIDSKATKTAVMAYLEKYRLYLLQTSLNRLPSITSSYSLLFNSNKLPSSSTEAAAIANVEYIEERERYLKWIAEGVNRLLDDQRSVIVLRYLGREELYDYQTYAELNMSERSYYRLKTKALKQLAIILRVEVYKEEVEFSGVC